MTDVANVKKLKNGKYRLRVYDKTNPASPYKCFTADSEKEVKKLANAYLYAREESARPENKTLEEAMGEYIDNRTNVLSPTTIALYRIITNSAFPTACKLKLGQLTQSVIQKDVNLYAGKHAYKTVSNAVAFLSVVLGEYMPKFNYKVQMPQKTSKEIKMPTTEQVAKLIEESVGQPIHLPILFAALLGLRRSEVCALTWDKIDLKANTVTIDEALVKDEFHTLVRKQPKTLRSIRTLSLPSIIVDALPPKGETIITLNPQMVTKRFDELVKKLGYDFTFHALRHYNASVMLQLNIPDKYAMERMGHSTNNMLKKVYQHTFEDETKRAADKLDSFFEKTLDPK